MVYGITGVAVVVSGAGVVYYLNYSRGDATTEDRRIASKKERRKAKKEKEKEETERVAAPTDPESPGKDIPSHCSLCTIDPESSGSKEEASDSRG